MPAMEYQMWNEHLLKYPFGDYYAQLLLAQLLLTVLKVGGSKSDLKIEDVAPWLFHKTPEELEKQEGEMLAARMQQIAMFNNLDLIKQPEGDDA